MVKMGRAFLQGEEATKTISLRLTIGMIKVLRRIAVETGLPMSYHHRLALNEYITQYEAKKDKNGNQKD